MALKPISPFTPESFKKRIEECDTVGRIVDAVESERGNWSDLFKAYRFRGMDANEGEKLRIDFNERIRNEHNRHAVAEDILSSLGMDPLNSEMRQKLDASLDVLDQINGDNWSGIVGRRIASISKVYEMWDPTKWVIYDSYCARAIQWMLLKSLDSEELDQCKSFLRVPAPQGRGVKTPVPEFPKNRATEKQEKLGFIYVSWLCQAIAEKLNSRTEKSDSPWKAYHVEMVAFQLGHHVP